MHARTNTYMRTYINACIGAQIRAYVHTNMHSYVHRHINTPICVHVLTCIYAHIPTCIHSNILTNDKRAHKTYLLLSSPCLHNSDRSDQPKSSLFQYGIKKKELLDVNEPETYRRPSTPRHSVLMVNPPKRGAPEEETNSTSTRSL